MVNKKILFLSIFIFMIVLSIGVASAVDMDDAIASSDDAVVLEDSEPTSSGSVSGGVDVVTENPGKTTGELTYDIPNDAKTIKSADVYVNVYSGSASNTYGANANITITTDNGVTNKSESLWTQDGSTDGTVYTVNDHTTKCYSDYMMHYDITDLLTGLNGTSLKINVDTFEMEGKQFDGKIKLIALVLAYDDGDEDSISYWINGEQLWTKSNVTITFDTETLTSIYGATLTNVVLSSGDGTYRLNNDFLIDPEHVTGDYYYQYNKWNATSLMKTNQKTTLNVAYAGTSAYGSIKNVLSVLTVNNLITDVSLAPEYTSVPSAYAGTNNTLTITVYTNKAGKYVVKLLADNVVVNETEMDLTADTTTLLLTDPTIRAVDETTVNGVENNKVNYTVELLLNDKLVDAGSINIPVLYNGNLGKDLAYPTGGMESFLNIVVTGGIEMDVKDVSSYLGASAMNRTDVWNVNLGADSSIVKSFIYVPYNWFNAKTYTEDMNMFNVTFNGANITPVAWYRDQGNLGNYGKYGYGVLVYDVTGLTVNGENSLELKKNYPTPAVYPSVLIYMYNTTGTNTIKEIYITNGADLLAGTSNNKANRPVKADSTISTNSKLITDATLYVFASSAQSGEGNIVFNGETHENVWSGTTSTTDLYTLDITGKVKDSNSISFVGTGSTILALNQIIVLTKNLDNFSISLAPEYTSVPSAYAGTNNAITVTIESVRSGKFIARLLADNVVVNETEIDLVMGTNKVILIDPTIRAVDESTVNGANNNKINYTFQLVLNDNIKSVSSISIPVLYNGNLGKDLAYPAGGMESFMNITINGDIVIDVKDVSSYLSAAAMNRTDVWNVNLGADSSIVKSFIYVPYNWFNAKTYTEDMNMFNVTFNGANITPVAWYRDQGNLGNYGKYGYGVLVYDVTGLTVNGENSFELKKNYPTPAVYPSVLIYMYNTTGSAVIRNVYISNGADLLAGTSNNVAGRIVEANSNIDVAAVSDTATLYVFAASAQSGEGNIVFNGNVYENVWSGTSSTTDLYTLDITGSVKNSNNISFVATGSTILALQQIIVTTQKAPTTITAPTVTTVYNVNKNLVITLKDANGNAVANAKLTVVLNGAKKVLTTNAKGQATLAIPNLAPKDYTASITYEGDATHVKSTATAKVIVKKAIVKLTAKKKTFKAKVKTKKYSVVLKDNKGKVMKKVKLTLKIKGKKFKATTNKKGKATFKIKKLTKKGKYTAKVIFNGDKYFNKLTKKVQIKIKK